MKSILILTALVALTHGRPEPPSGYNYPSPPSTRYGAPSGGQNQQGAGSSRSDYQSQPSARYGAPSGGQNQQGAGSSRSDYQPQPSARYGAPTGGQNQGGFDSSRSGSGFGGSFAGSAASAGSGFGAGFGGSYNSAQSSSSQSFGQSSKSSSGADSITINKHIYVHIPPPELEDEVQPKAQVRLPPPQKNYKIIFIKTPSASASQVPKIPPIPQNEEKTLVYVLVKKPEEQPEIVIPTAAPTEPSKPEVYFIKYQAQKESGAQQGAAGAVGGEDDSVTVEAAGKSNGNGGQGGAGEGQAGGYQNGASAGGSQNGASAGGYSYSASSSSSSSSSSNKISRQYGAPNSNGPY